MENQQPRLVDDGPGPEDPVVNDLPVDTDLTRKMMAITALTTMAFFLVYGALRIVGLEAPRSLLAMTWINGIAAGAIYGMTLIRKGSFMWLMAMIATVATMTGACFAVSQSTHNFAFLLIGAGVMFVGFLTALLRNFDERISFMPMVVSMLVGISLIIFSLGT